MKVELDPSILKAGLCHPVKSNSTPLTYEMEVVPISSIIPPTVDDVAATLDTLPLSPVQLKVEEAPLCIIIELVDSIPDVVSVTSSPKVIWLPTLTLAPMAPAIVLFKKMGKPDFHSKLLGGGAIII